MTSSPSSSSAGFVSDSTPQKKLSNHHVLLTSTSNPSSENEGTNEEYEEETTNSEEEETHVDDDHHDEEVEEDDDETIMYAAKDRLFTKHILAVVVSCWDNTVGPKPMRVWFGQHSKKLSHELITFVTRFTVMDELSREDQISQSGVELKFNVLSDMNIIVLTSTFMGSLYNSLLRNYASTVFSCSLIMEREQLQKYLSLHHIIKYRMTTLTRILQMTLNSKRNWQRTPLPTPSTPQTPTIFKPKSKRASLLTIGRITSLTGLGRTNKDDDDTPTTPTTPVAEPGPEFILQQFELRLKEFVQLFDTLFKTGLPPFTIDQTVFCGALLNSSNQAHVDFLQKAITSHLETHGYSVVIGTYSQIYEVNMWINTLACFLLPKERKLCRLAEQRFDPKSKFTPEIFIQGILYHPADYASVSEDQVWRYLVPTANVLSGRFPVSIIDVKNRQVLSFRKFQYFSGLKKDFFETNQIPSVHSPLQSNLQIWQHYQPNQQHSTPISQDRVKNWFSKSNNVSYSVQQLLKDLLLCGRIDAELRLNYVTEWTRYMHRRALTLCKYVEQETELDLIDCNNWLEETHTSKKSRNAASKELKKRILDLIVADARYMISDMMESELNILLATAEKLYPGVYMLVMGDPRKEVERVMQFLEEF